MALIWSQFNLQSERWNLGGMGSVLLLIPHWRLYWRILVDLFLFKCFLFHYFFVWFSLNLGFIEIWVARLRKIHWMLFCCLRLCLVFLRLIKLLLEIFGGPFLVSTVLLCADLWIFCFYCQALWKCFLIWNLWILGAVLSSSRVLCDILFPFIEDLQVQSRYAKVKNRKVSTFI